MYIDIGIVGVILLIGWTVKYFVEQRRAGGLPKRNAKKRWIDFSRKKVNASAKY